MDRNRALLDAITHLEDLKVLCVVAGFMECESRRELVLHHVLLSHRSKLNWLRLTFTGYHDDIHPLPWLHLLGDLHQLRRLDINFGELQYDGSYYEVANTLAKECPNVEKWIWCIMVLGYRKVLFNLCVIIRISKGYVFMLLGSRTRIYSASSHSTSCSISSCVPLLKTQS